MEIIELLHELAIREVTLHVVGCNAIEYRGRTSRLTDELLESMREHKPMLLQLLQPVDDYESEERLAIQQESELPGQDFDPANPGADLYDKSQSYWNHLDDEGKEYLRQPAGLYSLRCPYCRKIGSHANDCLEHEQIDFGKYKGRRLSQVPKKYLRYIVRLEGIKDEHRQQVRAELGRRQLTRLNAGQATDTDMVQYVAKPFVLGYNEASRPRCSNTPSSSNRQPLNEKGDGYG